MKSKEENIHSAHRERMRVKAKNFGFNTFENHELLEFVLFSSIPRANTNPMAHKLIKQCNNLLGVFSAKYNELKSIEGIGENTVLFLQAVGELYRRATKEKHKTTKLSNLQQILNHVKELFVFEKQEHLYAICLDKSNYLLGNVELGDTGAISEVVIEPTKAIKKILNIDPSMIVLAHNHVDNNLSISLDDAYLTTILYKMLKMHNINLIDHIIVCNSETLAFSDDNVMDKIRLMVNERKTETDIMESLGLNTRVKSDAYVFNPDLDKFL